MFTLIGLISLPVAAVISAVIAGYLFIDFQLQVGKFTWGRRLGIKRRPATSLPVTKDEAATSQRHVDKVGLSDELPPFEREYRG